MGSTGAAGILEFLFASEYGLKQLDIAISAHENKGDVRIISSPKIATLDNKQASMEQGLRIPYTKFDPTSGLSSVDFIEANLKLTVTPHVTNDGNIKLIITAKKDAPDFRHRTLRGPPALIKKRLSLRCWSRIMEWLSSPGFIRLKRMRGLKEFPFLAKYLYWVGYSKER